MIASRHENGEVATTAVHNAQVRAGARYTARLRLVRFAELEVFSGGTIREAFWMKILVVDDHALIRDAVRGVLKQLVDDSMILEAPDSRRATQLIQEHPDLRLILLDLNLPDCVGLVYLADLRKRYAPMTGRSGGVSQPACGTFGRHPPFRISTNLEISSASPTRRAGL